ncbi:GEVED domain-containing protein [Luteibaculum oceani]|uniref:T9SS type A sorting domain-containing protein n=1 Tax=Luteibaculum oceani TaxID=1294296 RepID=A0A5C6URE2_9FLAO|nr:GEVED domain-containing protein [Luteibaculum oceani]TXC75240.1 T9SS type A sorting domain-containing protein [Luteibaculum oceani]
MNNFTKRAIGLAILLLLFIAGNAQQKAVLKSIEAKLERTSTLHSIQPFSPISENLKNLTALPEGIDEAKLLSVNNQLLRKHLKSNTELTAISIPSFSGNWDLILEEVSLYSDDFILNTPQGIVPNENSGKFFRGIVQGAPNSIVSVSVFDDEIQALIALDGINYTLGKMLDKKGNPTETYILYNEGQVPTEFPNFCSAKEQTGKVREFSRDNTRKNSSKCVNVYFELDYDVFQNKGSVNGAKNYISAVFNEVATLYANDNLTVKISEIFVWNTASPYTGASSTSNLDQFRATRPNFNGDLGHLIDLKPSNGGIAYVDVLCNNTYNYAYSGIYDYYSNVPTYSWTVEVITHEIGHNLGSPHTHSCSWPGGPIDNCYTQEGACLPGPAPQNGGTIMSYCHLTSHGINFNNGFGPLPGDLIRDRVANANCLTTCSEGNVCAVPTGLSTANATQTSIDVSWNAASSANSYDLRFRPQGGSWTTITTSNTSYAHTGLAPSTTYEYQVKSNCSGESSAYSSTVTGTTQSDQVSYCSSRGNSTSDEWIQAITIGSFNHNSGNNSGYADFTNQTLTVTSGSSYAIDLDPGFSGGGLFGSNSYPEYWKIWIDYNGDGDFTDAGELAFDAGSTSNTNVTGSMQIKSGLSNTTTRMRVSMKYNAAQSSCETFSYGEVEDYTVSILEDVPQPCNTPTGLASSSVTHNSAVLSWNAEATASSYIVDYRVSGGSWTTVTSTNTSVTISGLQASTGYEARIASDCGNGNTSAYSGSISFTTDQAPPTPPSYCASKGNNSSDEWIKKITLGNFVNNSGNNGGYGDFTSSAFALSKGVSYNLLLEPGFSSGLFGTNSYPEYWKIWVDLNQDGDFSDSGELVFDAGSTSSSNVSGSFTIPSSALNGNTRLRVSMKYNGAQSPCETFSYGEVEDYTVNISSANTTASAGMQYSAGELSVELAPNPTFNIAELTIRGLATDEKSSILVSDITGRVVYQQAVVAASFNKVQLDLSNEDAGVYIVIVKSGDQKAVSRLVKK